MTARAQMEQVKLQELNLKNMKSTEDQSITYVLLCMLCMLCYVLFIEQLPLVVKQCLFHASNKSDHLQLHPEAQLYSNFWVALAMWHHGIFVYGKYTNLVVQQKLAYW